MSYRWTLIGLLGLLLSLGQSQFAFADPIVNGDFGAGSSGWQDTSDLGTASFAGGQATLSPVTDDSGLAGSIAQGDFLFSGALPILLDSDVEFLQFDVRGELAQDPLEVLSPFPFLDDYLAVSLFDYDDFVFDLFFALDPVLDFNVGSVFSTIMLDISASAGRSVGVFFDLFDEGTGDDLTLFIDNVSFVKAAAPPPAPVSEPGMLWLLLGGVGALFLGRMRARRIRSS